jgi:predicted anti-sigma-YlaC factor YlaD
MNKDKSLCSAFKDLFPSYIEGMVEDETKLWMDSHIEECSDCFKWIKRYQENGELKEASDISNVDTSSFEEDKKTIKKARIVIALGMVAVIILAIWTSIWLFV